MIILYILYLLLFVGGFYLFGAAFTAEAWQGLIFTAGVIAVSLALGLLLHTSRRT